MSTISRALFGKTQVSVGICATQLMPRSAAARILEDSADSEPSGRAASRRTTLEAKRAAADDGDRKEIEALAAEDSARLTALYLAHRRHVEAELDHIATAFDLALARASLRVLLDAYFAASHIELSGSLDLVLAHLVTRDRVGALLQIARSPLTFDAEEHPSALEPSPPSSRRAGRFRYVPYIRQDHVAAVEPGFSANCLDLATRFPHYGAKLRVIALESQRAPGERRRLAMAGESFVVSGAEREAEDSDAARPTFRTFWQERMANGQEMRVYDWRGFDDHVTDAIAFQGPGFDFHRDIEVVLIALLGHASANVADGGISKPFAADPVAVGLAHRLL